MKKLDFLFIYEVKARELENICLLKYELERRGYTVKFINTWYYINRKIPRYKAEVVITFALYNNDTYEFISGYIKNINKLVNMQWEQIGTIGNEESAKSRFLLSGKALDAAHICWGEITKNRLLTKCGVDERRLLLTGHITLDYFRNKLVNYFRTKEDIFQEYSLPLNKKVCLFISSFSYVELPKVIVNNTPDLGYSLDEFINLSIASQEEVLKWMASVLSKNSDVVFIYRPHPAEANSKKLFELVDQYSNFHVISDLSIKQWILVCDVLYTWYSTALAEIYASGKGCYILRPLPIPEEMELSICKDAEFITDFVSFESSLSKKEPEFPIHNDALSQYYYIDPDEPAYIKICDRLIDIYNHDYFILPEKYNKGKVSLYTKFRKALSRSFINKIINFLSYNTKINISVLNRRRDSNVRIYKSYMDDLAKRNYASKEEVDNIVLAIKNTLSK